MTMLATEHDPVRNIFLAVHPDHPGRHDNTDWQQRPLDQMTSQIWHGDDDDHGAMTRFGMGWGPLEVVRAHREVKNDKGPKVYRVLEIFGGGTLRLRIRFSPTGRSFTVTDLARREHDDQQRTALVALDCALQDVAPGLPDEVWDALDALKKTMD